MQIRILIYSLTTSATNNSGNSTGLHKQVSILFFPNPHMQQRRKSAKDSYILRTVIMHIYYSYAVIRRLNHTSLKLKAFFN